MGNFNRKTPDSKSQDAKHSPGAATGNKAAILQDNRTGATAQAKVANIATPKTGAPEVGTHHQLVDNRPLQKKANNTGLPGQLKTGIENLSGHSLDDVKVYYNSAKPAQLQALAYAQGNQIHVAPGQEKHLPHEAWHVVQQKQGRVKPTLQMKTGVAINDDKGLEKEADVMGQQALQMVSDPQASANISTTASAPANVVQRLTGFEAETNIPIYDQTNNGAAYVNPEHTKDWQPEIGHFLFGGLTYGLTYGHDRDGHFTISADHNPLQRAHRKIVTLLIMHGLLLPGAKYRSMSNMEYISTARDEMAPDFEDLFKEDVDLVHHHLSASLSIAKSNNPAKIPMSAGIVTGVPHGAILAWAGASGADVDPIEEALVAMHQMINDQLYLQQTTGALPSEIPAMYATAAKQIGESNPWKDIIMADVMESSNHIGAAAFDAANITDPDFLEHKASVVGFLVYLATHLLADSLSLTDFVGETSTTKNLLPYFPKVPLSVAFQALPVAVRKTAIWNILNDKLFAEAHGLESKHWVGKYTLKLKKVDLLDETALFKEALVETEDADGIFSYHESQERPNAKAALTSLAEGDEVHIGVEKNLEGLDWPNMSIKPGEMAIPVEDRFFNSKFGVPITGANFGAALSTTVKDSQQRYAKHVDPSVTQVKPPKPGEDAVVLKRIAGKKKWIEDQVVSMQATYLHAERTIVSYTERLKKTGIETEHLLHERSALNDAITSLQPLATEMLGAHQKVKAQMAEVISGAMKQEELDKEPDYQSFKQKRLSYQSLMTSINLGTLSEIKDKLKKLELKIGVYQKNIVAMEKMITATTENIKKIRSIQHTLKMMEDNPVAEGSDPVSQDEELDDRVFHIRRVQNAIQNSLGDKDASLDKKATIENFKKSNQLSDLKNYIAYRKRLNPESFSIGENRDKITGLLTQAHQMELKIAELEIEIDTRYGSPAISKVIAPYLKITAAYKELFLQIVRLEKADKDEEEHAKGSAAVVETVS